MAADLKGSTDWFLGKTRVSEARRGQWMASVHFVHFVGGRLRYPLPFAFCLTLGAADPLGSIINSNRHLSL